MYLITIKSDENKEAFVFQTVYNDKVMALMQELGDVTIKRASSVEYNACNKMWEATYLETGTVIASNSSRERCVELEVEWLKKNMFGVGR